MAKKLSGMGLLKDVIWKPTIITPTQALKVKWKNTKGEECSLSEAQIKRLEKEYISQLEGKLSVVPESDKHKALSFAVQFPAVEAPAAPAAPELPSWLIGN